jgi:glycosyltransferase involved in cell wall biosynthesis
MKKICIVTTSHSAQETRVFHKEAKTLAGFGYEISLIAPGEGEVVTGRNIKNIYLPQAKKRISRFLVLPQIAYRLALKEKASIYHFHDPELIPWMIMIKLFARTKVIYDVHEDFPADLLQKKWLPRPLKKLFSICFDFFEKKAAAYFDYIVVVNDSLKEKFVKKGICKVEIVSNYPVLHEESTNISRIPSKRGKLPRIVYVGSISEEYGIREIILAHEMISDKIVFELIGSFDDQNLEKEISRRKTPNLDFIGRIPHQEVYEYLMAADIAIICFGRLPNYLNTGVGSNKLFEYMAAGLPIIATDFPNLKKIVEGNQCGICVDSSKPQEITRVIQYLIDNPVAAKEMGKNGKQAAQKKYNWGIEADKLLKIYKILCAE